MILVLVAAPSARTICPPEYLEGLWYETPDDVNEVRFKVAAMDLYQENDPSTLVTTTTLVARRNGKMQRRDDGVTAPVFEVRHAEDW